MEREFQPDWPYLFELVFWSALFIVLHYAVKFGIPTWRYWKEEVWPEEKYDHEIAKIDPKFAQMAPKPD